MTGGSIYFSYFIVYISFETKLLYSSAIIDSISFTDPASKTIYYFPFGYTDNNYPFTIIKSFTITKYSSIDSYNLYYYMANYANNNTMTLIDTWNYLSLDEAVCRKMLFIGLTEGVSSSSNPANTIIMKNSYLSFIYHPADGAVENRFQLVFDPVKHYDFSNTYFRYNSKFNKALTFNLYSNFLDDIIENYNNS